VTAPILAATDVLSAWDIAPLGPVEAIEPEGTFRVLTESKDDLILTRIGSIGAQTVKQATLEYDVLQHLGENGLPVPVPLLDRQERIAVPKGGHL
jgi:Ser/Thr protein kinase RdoA (MazF antagonist)